MKMHNNKALSVLKGVAVALFWLAVWWALALAVNKELLLPDPLEVGKRFCALVVEAEFWRITISSLLRVLAGFALGMLAGLALAILMHKSKILFALLAPFIKAVRATPVASFIILALVWIASPRLPIFISFLMVLPIAWANASSGIENTDKQLLEMASLFKVKTWRIWADIYWPSLRPYLLAAATTGLGLAWKSGITAEVIASPKFAIGSELQSAKVYLETPDIFVWTIVVVFLSIVLEKLLLRLLRKGAS